MNNFFRTLPVALLMLSASAAIADHHKENDVAPAFTQIVGQTESEKAALLAEKDRLIKELEDMTNTNSNANVNSQNARGTSSAE